MSQLDHETPVDVRPDWRTNPRAFVADCRDRCPEGVSPFGSISEPFAEVVEAGRMAFDKPEEGPSIAVAALRLAQSISDTYRQSYASPDAGGFVRVGPFAFPPTPEGIGALRVLREHSPGIVRGPVDSFATEGSAFARVADALRDVSHSVLVDGIRNATRATDDRSANPAGFVQFGIGLTMRPAVIANLPTLTAGTTFSPGMLVPDLVGYEFDGEEIQSWQSHVGACDDGTAEFLRRFGVDVEREHGGCVECDHCGSEHDSEEDGEISYCSDFVIDERMARALEKAGYADGTRDWIREQGCEESAESWEELDGSSVADLLAKYGPVQSTVEGKADPGVRYNASAWTFEPAPETLEGLDEIDDAGMLLSLGRKIGAVCDAHSAAGSLPPVPGRLSFRHYDVSFDWNPDAGTLRHRLGERATFVVDVTNGARAVEVRTDRLERFALGSEGGDTISLPFDAAGDSASLFLRLACAEVSL